MRAVLSIAFCVLALSAAVAGSDSGWSIAGGRASGTCHAVKRGAAVDTQLLLNDKGKMILVAGWPGRDLPGAATYKAELGIDDAPAIPIEVITIGPLALYAVNDDAVAQQLRSAKTIHWRFPWGSFTADVTGLGEAADAVLRCTQS